MTEIETEIEIETGMLGGRGRRRGGEPEVEGGGRMMESTVDPVGSPMLKEGKAGLWNLSCSQ